MNTTKVPINNESDVIVARMEARQLAKQIGFNTVDQARISLAASELARLAYRTINQAREIIISDTKQENLHGMQVICLVDLANTTASASPEADQTVTAQQGAFQQGLTNITRLVDESSLGQNEAGQTLVTLIKWFR